MRIMPYGLWMALVNCSRLHESKPSRVRSSWRESLSRMRMTVFSPKIVGSVEALGRRHDLVQHAVHTEADAEDLFVGLEMDVRGAAADRVHEDHVDQTHDRR